MTLDSSSEVADISVYWMGADVMYSIDVLNNARGKIVVSIFTS